MGTPEKNPLSVVPKISQKLAYRTLFLVIVFGGLAYGLMWFLKVRSDLGGLAVADTKGWISAVEYLPQGQQAVLISPDGKIHNDAGHVANTVDRDLTWSPHGNFLYFVSDREDHNFNLFRWAPGKLTDPPERRTIGTRARSNLTFAAQPVEEPDKEAKGLIVTGGLVLEFDPSTQTTQQILPPTTKEIAQSNGNNNDERGTESQFEGAYGTLGTSFRIAQRCNNGKSIIAVMRRDAGEILILQDMTLVDGKYVPPRPIVAGDHIDFAVNPKDGTVVYTVNNFQWPDPTAMAAKSPDGKLPKRPFKNAIVYCDLADKVTVLVANEGDMSFYTPAISPDGSGVAVVLSKETKSDSQFVGLALLSTTNDPNFKRHTFGGDIHEPSWSPDGTHILAAVRPNGKSRTIFEIPTDGSPPRNVSGEGGNFGFPKYSPQQKS